jgi:hypothetical protein
MEQIEEIIDIIEPGDEHMLNMENVIGFTSFLIAVINKDSVIKYDPNLILFLFQYFDINK